MLKRKMLDKLIAWKQKAGGRDHFVKGFLRHNQYIKFDIFPCNYVT